MASKKQETKSQSQPKATGYNSQVHQFSQQEKDEVRKVVEESLKNQGFSAPSEAGSLQRYEAGLGAIGDGKILSLLIKYGPAVLQMIRDIIDEWNTA